MHDTNRQYTGVTAIWEDIDPELAKTYLTRNLNNRNEKVQKIDSYTRDMAANGWKTTGSAIQFDRLGRLIDGQNRLRAVIKSGCTVRFLVVRGLEPEAQEHIDRGATRTLADALAMRGEAQSNYLGAALSIVWRIREGKINPGDAPTDAELLNLLDQNPALRESFAWIHPCRPLLPPSHIIAFHYLFSCVDPLAADTFMEGIAEGTDPKQRDALYVLRQRLIRNAGAKAKLPRPELWALIIKAWNAMQHQTPMKRSTLRWRSTEPRPEPFPEIDGVLSSTSPTLD